MPPISPIEKAQSYDPMHETIEADQCLDQSTKALHEMRSRLICLALDKALLMECMIQILLLGDFNRITITDKINAAFNGISK